MIIRKATPNDFGGFYRINEQADTFHQTFAPYRFKKPDESYQLFMFNRFCDFIQGGGSFVLVAVSGKTGELLGYLIAIERQIPEYPILFPRKYIMVDNMGVDEHARNKGIGTLLLQRLEEEAVRLGYSEIELNVYDFNEAGKRLYAKNGFSPVTHRMRKEIK